MYTNPLNHHFLLLAHIDSFKSLIRLPDMDCNSYVSQEQILRNLNFLIAETKLWLSPSVGPLVLWSVRDDQVEKLFVGFLCLLMTFVCKTRHNLGKKRAHRF